MGGGGGGAWVEEREGGKERERGGGGGGERKERIPSTKNSVNFTQQFSLLQLTQQVSLKPKLSVLTNASCSS